MDLAPLVRWWRNPGVSLPTLGELLTECRWSRIIELDSRIIFVGVDVPSAKQCKTGRMDIVSQIIASDDSYAVKLVLNNLLVWPRRRRNGISGISGRKIKRRSERKREKLAVYLRHSLVRL